MKQGTFFRVGLWAMVGVFAIGAVMLFWLSVSGRTAGDKPYGTPFALVDQNGTSFTNEDLKGAATAIFFGYTHCPDVCPTTLYDLGGQQKKIEAKGGTLRVVFVTVDPQRDTVEVMKDYVAPLGADVVALTGSSENIAEMLKGWGIYAAKVGEGADYSMDHSAQTILLDTNGSFVGTIAYGEDPASEQAKLDKLAGV